jgi:hypothetical protein
METHKGRVIYKRKRHEMSLKDVVRMCERLSINLSREELSKNPYMCNAIFEIVRTAFYPIWQRASAPRELTTDDSSFFYNVEPKLRNEWKKMTFEICKEIGKELEIPQYIVDFVMDYLANTIWEVIWSITDPFFSSAN